MTPSPQLHWERTGAKAYFYSADSPEARGPGHDLTWCDEAGFYTRLDMTGANLYDNLTMTGSEASDRSRRIITSTPTNLKFLRQLIDRAKNGDPEIQFTHEPMEANRSNLPPGFIEQMSRDLVGTPRYKTEVLGELPDEVGGRLLDVTNDCGRKGLVPRGGFPTSWRAVCDAKAVSVDPAGTSNSGSDETAISVCGRYKDGEEDRYAVFVLEGHKMGPDAWIRRARDLAEEWGCTHLYVETNQMRDAVERMIKQEIGDLLVVETFHSTRSKEERAHPIVNLYARGVVSHSPGVEVESEDQMMSFPVLSGIEGDDRVDALVFGMTPILKSREAMGDIAAVVATTIHHS